MRADNKAGEVTLVTGNRILAQWKGKTKERE